MKELEQVLEQYNKYREWGFNVSESADKSINEVFKGIPIKPFIYKDNYEDASHVFFGDNVLFFHGAIYTK